MTWNLFFLIIIAAGMFLAGFIPGHRSGRRSCRNEYPDGWDAGQAAERQRWEQATGATWDALAGWNAARPQDAEEWEAWLDTGEPPTAEVLLRTAELDQMAAEYEAAQGRAPVVAGITDATRWHRARIPDVTTVEGKVVAAPGPDPGTDWDLLAGSTLPGYAAAALGGHRTVDECVDSIVMRAVGR